MQVEESDLDWVLILAPYRRDGAYLEALLVEHGLPVQQALDAEAFVACITDSPGVVVVTHEALTPDVIEAVSVHLVAQAHWSELPIVVLLDRSVPHARIRSQLEKIWPGARQIYYQRPVAGLELISGIQSALAIRRRQKEVRDHIDKEVEFRLELNHRVKNILASVSSIFQMTRRGAHSVDELAEDFEGRLNALANVHSAVFQAGGDAVSLATVIDLTVLPYRTEGEGRLGVHGPDITITGEAGTTLALCLHELATNAIKYGAMSQVAGKVLLTWEVTSDTEPVFTMEWQESGGPPVSAPTRVGYGTRYIRSALATLFGEPPVMSYAAEGFRCTVSGPLQRISPDDRPERPIL
ncbi:two-component sensor histidine kinase [Devosia sp. UYZn731]|uniref:sensor histidine kinase n=1 Tax=Devosia sp. UYZn731 TaxID=3156345 RepID=UPI003398F0D4